jgi:hypothetical protein
VRVAELEKAVAELRDRLIALARILPPDYVRLLDREAAAVEAAAPSWSILEGWQDSVVMKSSHVGPEMQRLWARLDPKVDRGTAR